MQTDAQTDGSASLRAGPDELARLRSIVRGPLITPGDPDYEVRRRVYNALIDRHPALITRCVDAADVKAIVDFARDHGALLAVRSGGHNVAGLGSCDNGIVLDLGLMKGVHVDPVARTARVAAGCVWGDVDHATHLFGLATPSGFISSTGVGGLTLGGGLGYLTRRFGYAIDNLLEADVVLADGRLVTANSGQHEDLFWALRGGGGNFGVVTSFLFRLHPVADVIGGPTFWPLDRCPEILRWYRDFLRTAPEELSGFFAFMTVPPVAPFPEALHGRKVCAIVWCYSGDEERADDVFAPVRQRAPLLYGVHRMPYPMLQSAFDRFYPPGLSWYWRADFFTDLTDEMIDLQLSHAERLPTGLSTVHIYPVDGAANRVDGQATAFSCRDARFTEIIVGVDPDPDQAPAFTSWARSFWQALHPHAAGGAYVNFLMDEGDARVRASYGDNYDRLVQIKDRYDPTNLFRVNQNIRPSH